MSKTVGDFLVHRLQQWGVRHLFGYPGDGINGVFGALNRADGKIRFIQARHEEMAWRRLCFMLGLASPETPVTAGVPAIRVEAVVR